MRTPPALRVQAYTLPVPAAQIACPTLRCLGIQPMAQALPMAGVLSIKPEQAHSRLIVSRLLTIRQPAMRILAYELPARAEQLPL